MYFDCTLKHKNNDDDDDISSVYFFILRIYCMDNGNKKLTLEGFAEFFLPFVRNQTDRFIKGNITSSSSAACNTFQHSSVKAQENESQNASDTFKSTDLSSSIKSPDVESEYPSYHDDISRTPKSISSTKYQKVNRRNFTDSPRPNTNLTIQSKTNFEASDSNFKNDSAKKTNRQSDITSSCLNNKNRSNENVKSFGRQTFCLGDFLTLSSPSRQRHKSIAIDQKNSSNSSHSTATNTTSKLNSLTNANKTKSKKRVTPITIASSSTTTSNISTQKDEIKIVKSIKKENQDIKSTICHHEFENLQIDDGKSEKITSPAQTNTQSPTFENKKISLNSSKAVNEVSIEKSMNSLELNEKRILDRFIEIYSALIDLHLVINILSEMSYLFHLIHAEGNIGEKSENTLLTESLTESNKKLETTEIETSNNLPSIELKNDSRLINKSNDEVRVHTILKKLSNCIYFAIRVLEKQKHLLALLDVTTLKIILDSDRLESLATDLKKILLTIYSHKIKLESKNSDHEISFKIGCNFTNVSYQQDNDTKNNFPSSKEFNAFNKQRDMFYNILRIWESNHLNHTWNFSQILGPKIRELFDYMEHPINMAHLAKLFTSQLIISSNFPETSNESEMGPLLNVNRKKLNKLCQRLVAPNNFSTDYHFPGNEIFFKEFLSMTNSVVFLEQLKITLIAELIELNNSSYEIINLQFKSENGNEYNEYVVRPETISVMRTLGKFLGLVISRPFSYEGYKNTLVDNRQIELRNMIQPPFDVMKFVKTSIIEKKLIITLPWVVQYLFMLDHITLQLDYYRELIQLLYELYMNLNSNSNCTENTVSELLKMRPSSVFILRLCLGWLFEHHFQMSENYFDYRKAKNSISKLNNDKVLNKNNKTAEITDALFNTLIIDEKHTTGNGTDIADVSNISLLQSSFDLLLEEILNVACPFLADFRMSIMTNKSVKSRSRPGRYRYVITKISPDSLESPTSTAMQSHEDNIQEKLTEAFLHSQSLSMRRIIEFVIERTTSAVIKDYQMEILIPSKSKAMNKILDVKSMKLEEITEEIRLIFTNAHKEAMEMWSEKIPEMIKTRVNKSLEGLLPNETMNIVRKTCTSLIIEKCKIKTENWKLSNLNNLDFYSKNIESDAEKFFKSNVLMETSTTSINKQPLYATNLIVDITKERPSIIFEELQNWLHFTSFRSEYVNENALEKFCIDFLKCLQVQTLPTSVYRLSGFMTIALVQNLIKLHENVLTNNIINKFIDIWLCDKIIDFIKITKNNSSSHDQESPLNEERNILMDVNETNLFDSLITKSFIHSIQNKPLSFNCLSQLLISVINANLFTIDYLNEKFVALFKEDWSESVLKQLSSVLDNIRKNTSCNTPDDAKSQLFMEMLADFARDLDEF